MLVKAVRPSPKNLTIACLSVAMLNVGERIPDREHPPARPHAGFKNSHIVARLQEFIPRCQPTQAGTQDDDAFWPSTTLQRLWRRNRLVVCGSEQ